jgi:putative phage-type endonuclease
MLTQADLEVRKKWIGASEAATVLGLNPFQTPYDVWALKTNRCEDGGGNDATDLGNRLESVVLDWAEEDLGTLVRNVRKNEPRLYLGATYDALTASDNEPVEAKTSGLLGPLSDEWGDPGTDQVPGRIIVQAHVQMLLAPSDVCYIPALLGGRGFQMFVVERNDELIDVLISEIPAWWERHVVADTPPDAIPSPAIIKRLKRTPGKIATINPTLADSYRLLSDEASKAEHAKERAKMALLAAMDDAEAADFGDAEKWLTYFEQTTNRFDEPRFKEAHPDLHKQFIRQSSYRVLRLVKRPKAPRQLPERTG